MDDDYELLDAGGGRRLERFGRVVLDRPAPGATDPPRTPAAWDAADGRFERDPDGGRWVWRTPPPDPWIVRIGGIALELRPTASGQVGLFPEHVAIWAWLTEEIRAAVAAGATPRVLNLFAYTGGATLAAAAAGGSVVHVDGARSAVDWARRNAAVAQLDHCPIRWIVDDALAFLAREVRRGHRYEVVIADPPSWGHAPRGRRWTFRRDAGHLVDLLVAVLAKDPVAVVVTAHRSGLQAAQLGAVLGGALGRATQAGDLLLVARSGARLTAGVYARWPPARILE
jgi:23S rRNA (cytosine1962-C5)-methyltransferase